MTDKIATALSTALPPEFLATVARDFPGDFASTDPADLETYGRDWVAAFRPRAAMLCRPRTVDEVSRLLRACTHWRVPVVPSGGRTGLAGGALAIAGEVVLSLERMDRIEPVDPLGFTVRVEAGATVEALGARCAEVDLFWPIELDSKGAQVGGTLSTNAGGMRAFRYGLARRWALGLTVVLAGGEVLELNGALEKDNAGVDLRQLFIGSEGILGVITGATLKLARRPDKVAVALLAVPSLEGVLRVFERARRAPFELTACELFTDRCLARIVQLGKVAPPFDAASSHYVLLELEVTERDGSVEAWVDSLYRSGLATTGTVTQDPVRARELWSYRKGISAALAAAGAPPESAIALPVARIGAFSAELDRLVVDDYPDLEPCLFGHVGDGSLHVSVVRPEAMEPRAFLRRRYAFDAAVCDLALAHRGSVTAEHGIGWVKKARFARSRGAVELGLIRAFKQTLDPLGILNPGKVL